MGLGEGAPIFSASAVVQFEKKWLPEACLDFSRPSRIFKTGAMKSEEGIGWFSCSQVYNVALYGTVKLKRKKIKRVCGDEQTHVITHSLLSPTLEINRLDTGVDRAHGSARRLSSLRLNLLTRTNQPNFEFPTYIFKPWPNALEFSLYNARHAC